MDGIDYVGVGENGRVYAEIPVASTTAKLTVDGVERTLCIGRLDPVQTARGAQARLVNLGYLVVAEPNDEWNARTLMALRAFQLVNGLVVSGVADSVTLKTLRKAAGA